MKKKFWEKLGSVQVGVGRTHGSARYPSTIYRKVRRCKGGSS